MTTNENCVKLVFQCYYYKNNWLWFNWFLKSNIHRNLNPLSFHFVLKQNQLKPSHNSQYSILFYFTSPFEKTVQICRKIVQRVLCSYGCPYCFTSLQGRKKSIDFKAGTYRIQQGHSFPLITPHLQSFYRQVLSLGFYPNLLEFQLT